MAKVKVRTVYAGKLTPIDDALHRLSTNGAWFRLVDDEGVEVSTTPAPGRVWWAKDGERCVIAARAIEPYDATATGVVVPSPTPDGVTLCVRLPERWPHGEDVIVMPAGRARRRRAA
jgi:hypothetical protein